MSRALVAIVGVCLVVSACDSDTSTNSGDVDVGDAVDDSSVADSAVDDAADEDLADAEVGLEAVGDCDPEYVGRRNGTIEVRPYDYSTHIHDACETGDTCEGEAVCQPMPDGTACVDTYEWYDAFDIDHHILKGEDATPLAFPVLDQQGQPNLPPYLTRVPNAFSQPYGAPLPVDPEVSCTEGGEECADGSVCVLDLGLCAVTCEETADCRTEAQLGRGTFGGYVCGDSGVCITPEISLVTQLLGFADRFDGDPAPGGDDDLDPDDLADALGLSSDPVPHPEGLACEDVADCPLRSPGDAPYSCIEGACMRESDRDVYNQFLARYERRQQVLAEQQALVEDVFGADSNNLQCAFDAAETGESIELAHDTGEVYTLNETIVVRGFEGEFFGQGIDETRIEIAPGGVKNGPPPFFDLRPERFIFEEGDFTVRDMTLHAGGGNDYGAHLLLFDMTGFFYVTGENHAGPYDPDEVTHVSSTFENVRMLGAAGEQFQWGFNLLGAIIACGEQLVERDRFGGNLYTAETRIIEGDHEVTGCEATDSLNGLFVTFGGPKDSEVVVRDNTVTNADLGFYFADADGSTITMMDNFVSDGGLVGIEEGFAGFYGVDFDGTGVFPSAPSVFTIRNNHSVTAGRWWGNIEMHSLAKLADLTPSEVHIITNRLEFSDNFPGALGAPYAYEGLFADGFDDVEVDQNSFLCDPGISGIYAGLFGDPDSGWEISRNAFEGCAVDVHLGPATSGMVVEGLEDTTVNDETCTRCQSNDDCADGATCSDLEALSPAAPCLSDDDCPDPATCDGADPNAEPPVQGACIVGLCEDENGPVCANTLTDVVVVP